MVHPAAPMSSGTSVHSTCSGLVTVSMNQPTSSQVTAFVQPTQQQAANQDAANQDAAMEAERPSTSSSLSGTGERDTLLHHHHPLPSPLTPHHPLTPPTTTTTH